MNNVICTNVKYFRNVKDYKFLPKLEEEKRKEIYDLVSKVVTKEMKFIDQSNKEDFNKLYELNLILPNSKTIFADLKNDVILSLFEDEHIKINAGGLGYDEKIFTNAKKIENLIKDKINLTYSDEYGYLTSNLVLIGNGMRISSVLDLSSLKEMGKIDKVTQNVKNLGYILRHIGENLYELSTSCTLGFTESEVITEFGKMLNKVDDLENESLRLQDIQNHDEIIDRAHRSYGVLTNAYLLNVDELKKHVSNILRGINLDELKVDKNAVLKLYSLCRTKTNFITKNDMKNLATTVQNILKGEDK